MSRLNFLGTIFFASGLLLGLHGQLAAQDAPSVAAPQGMPPEIAAMLGSAQASGASTTVAVPQGMPPEIAAMLGSVRASSASTGIAPPQEQQGTAGTAAALRYLYTTLRVTNNGSPRGCGYADWNCLTNLCKQDLGSTAWRGWAGCWRRDSWICYFECGQQRDAF